MIIFWKYDIQRVKPVSLLKTCEVILVNHVLKHEAEPVIIIKNMTWAKTLL